MDHERLLAFVRDVCEQAGVLYTVVGSSASITYGEPCFTKDADVVIVKLQRSED